MKAAYTIAVTALLACGGHVLAQTPTSPATIPESKRFEIHSESVGADFLISVSFPYGYDQMAEARFAALYLPDAYWTFGMASDIARVLAADELIAPMLVIGIGYAGGLGDVISLRTRDMTLRRSETVEQIIGNMVAQVGGGPPVTSGGADKFMRFLTDELIPVIERDYRADPNRRVLHGHSLGGNFVIDVLFSQPRAFRHYISSAPALQIDDGVSFVNEQRYAADHDSLSASLYLAVGLSDSPELVASVNALADTLKGRAYRGFEWEVSRLRDQTHRSVMPVVLRDAVRWIFGK